jgi:hypothetical protein
MKNIDWLQLIILPVAIAIMVVAWLEPWAQWFVLSTGVDRAGLVPPPALMLMVILASTYTTRYALHRARYQRRLIVLGGLLATVIVSWLTYHPLTPLSFLRNMVDWQNSIAPEVVVVVATAALWWRGVLVGRSRALIDENLERTFFNGVLALALLLFLNHFTRHVSVADVLAAVLIFFATALSALTVINIERTRLQQPDGGSWLKRQRHWFATIFGVVGAILLTGVVIAGIFSPDTLRQFLSSIGPGLSAVGNVVLGLLRPIFTFLAWLISPLIPILQFILRGVMEGILTFLRVLHEIGVQINTLRAQQAIQTFLDSPEFATFSRGTTVVLILLLFAVLAIWALRRSGLLSRRNPDETRESVATRDLLLQQLKNFLARWRGRSAVPTPPYLTLSGDDPRTTVRLTYQSFLEWARVTVGARTPHQTPAKYADSLVTHLPSQRVAITTLTETYVRARYAVEEPSAADVRAAQESLASLQTISVIKSDS